MKKLLLLITILCVSLSGYAQDNDPMRGVLSIQSGRLDGNGLNPMEFAADFGVNATKWLAVMVRGESSLGLFKSDISKTYYTSGTIGGVLDFTLFHSQKAGALSLQAAVGCTIGGNEWKYVYYQGGIYYSLNRSSISPVLGFGVRYYNSQSNSFDNYTRVFFSVGFRLF